MKSASVNPLLVAITLVLMLLIAGMFGYRLQVSTTGLVFERDAEFIGGSRTLTGKSDDGGGIVPSNEIPEHHSK